MEQITSNHPLSKSADIIKNNIDTLRSLFPHIVKEGKIDVEELKALFGEEIEEGEEYYRFTWAGKSKARQEANKPSTGTLRPLKEVSKDWDTTQNIFIEGDNLEVLKLLQKSYASSIKMIYIDPPYNTGNDFVYMDDYADNLKNYLSITRQVDEEGNQLSTNTESDGRYHSNWLNMLYPRLRLARNLLENEGIIFISIDDKETHNLRKVCDEIFGEENFLSAFIWEKKKKGAFLSGKFTNIKEYIVAYCKNKNAFKGLVGEINDDLGTYPCVNESNKREIRTVQPGIVSKYKEKNYELKKGQVISAGSMDLVLHSDLVIKEGRLAEELIIEGNWRYDQDSMDEFAEAEELYLTEDLYLRRIVTHPRLKRLKDFLPKSGKNSNNDPYITKEDIKDLFLSGWGTNEDAKEEIKNLTGVKNLMDYPKPSKLIAKLIASIRETDFIILDFFAGSATTAQSVMELNSLDGGQRRFICVQLPEVTGPKTNAFKAGYKTISEIARHRIIKAGEKIKNEVIKNLFSQETKNIDLGFRTFKLDSSNINAWDGNIKNFEQNLLAAVENIKPDRTEEDVLYEVLLKSGLDLSQPIEQKRIAEKTVFNIGVGALFICLGNDLTIAVAEGIGKWKQELDPATCRVIFKDTGFNDIEKANSIQVLKRYGINEVNTI